MGLPKSRELLNILLNQHRSAIRLFDALLAGGYKNEEELTGLAGLDKAAYKRASRALIESLSKLVVLIQGEKIYPDDWKRQTLENNRRSAALRILSSCNAKNAAALLAEESLENALRINARQLSNRRFVPG